jgi:hypothetical protein
MVHLPLGWYSLLQPLSFLRRSRCDRARLLSSHLSAHGDRNHRPLSLLAVSSQLNSESVFLFLLCKKRLPVRRSICYFYWSFNWPSNFALPAQPHLHKSYLRCTTSLTILDIIILRPTIAPDSLTSSNTHLTSVITTMYASYLYIVPLY